MKTSQAPDPPQRRLLNYERAAAYLGVSERMVAKLADAGEFPKVTGIGTRVLFDRRDLDDFVERVKARL